MWATRRSVLKMTMNKPIDLKKETNLSGLDKMLLLLLLLNMN